MVCTYMKSSTDFTVRHYLALKDCKDWVIKTIWDYDMWYSQVDTHVLHGYVVTWWSFSFNTFKLFVNQARQPAHAWFLKIALVHALMCVCVSAPKGINNQ